MPLSGGSTCPYVEGEGWTYQNLTKESFKRCIKPCFTGDCLPTSVPAQNISVSSHSYRASWYLLSDHLLIINTPPVFFFKQHAVTCLNIRFSSYSRLNIRFMTHPIQKVYINRKANVVWYFQTYVNTPEDMADAGIVIDGEQSTEDRDAASAEEDGAIAMGRLHPRRKRRKNPLYAGPEWAM